MWRKYIVIYGTIAILLYGDIFSGSWARGQTPSIPAINLVEDFLTQWAKDKYFQAAAKLADDDVEVSIDGKPKVLSRHDSRFEIGLHPVRFMTIVPSGNKIVVSCVLVSEREFGSERFSHRTFSFEISENQSDARIERISVTRRKFVREECPTVVV